MVPPSRAHLAPCGTMCCELVQRVNPPEKLITPTDCKWICFLDPLPIPLQIPKWITRAPKGRAETQQLRLRRAGVPREVHGAQMASGCFQGWIPSTNLKILLCCVQL